MNHYKIFKTKKGIFLSIFSVFLLIPELLSAQAWKADEYDGVPSKDKRVILNDPFTDDLNMWGDRYTKVSRVSPTALVLKCPNETGYHRSIPVYYGSDKNYQLEANVQWLKGASSPIGITFGRSEMDESFDFVISADGTFAVAEHTKTSNKYLKTPTNGFNLLTDNYNLLTVRKAGTQWYFFINREMVCEMPAKPLFGKEVGFVLGGKGTLNANSFTVTELISADKKNPILVLTNPSPQERGGGEGATLKCMERTPIIEGRAGDVSGIKEVKINGYSVKLSPDFRFAHQIQMKTDMQEVKIEASDNNGNITVRVYTLQYENPDNQPIAAKEKPQDSNGGSDAGPKGKPVGEPVSISKGITNHAIFIGITDYRSWSLLNNTIYDCKTVSKVLLERYQFEERHTTFLFNDRATRDGILRTFDSLQRVLNEKDNLLIYYAGHGHYDSLSNLGYWIPIDGIIDRPYTYVTNTQVKDYVKSFRTHHTFLIADACFAGSLFIRGSQVLDEEAKSRWAFASGDIEYVNDGVPGTNSPFAKYLIQELESNTSAAIRADDLIIRVSQKVRNNVKQSPKGLPIHGVGDEGGVFVFRKKKR
ncbi:MAG: caspase domain-containing protein [Bacteroidia bacterium]